MLSCRVGRALSVALCCLSFPTAAQAAGARAAVVLQPAPATRLPASALAALCLKLRVPCSHEHTQAHVARGHGDGPLWLIDASRPMLVALDPDDPLDAERARPWDFAEHAHSTLPGADGGSAPPLQIHPALYPVGRSAHAIALVSETREMYSGGGASFRTADFVVLDAERTLAYGAVPFSCSKMVRACFSERDYARGHCHDESAGSLTIRYPEGEGRWTFLWRETQWPAFTPRSRATTERVVFQVPPGNTRRSASVGFCGGPFE